MPVDKFGRMSETKTEDAVPRSFVDGEIRALKEQIEKRKHLITINARYCGELKNEKYQFKFGGGNFENCEEIIEQYEDLKGSITGFVMPHSGRIKKIICEVLTFRSAQDIIKFYFDLLTNYKKKKLQLSDFRILKHQNYKDIEDILKKGFEDFVNKQNEFSKYVIETYKESDNSNLITMNIKPDFQIVKFEKNLKKDYYNTYPNDKHPEIITSVLTEEMESKILIFMINFLGNGVIQRRTSKHNFTLSEGDVINIKTKIAKSPFLNIDIDDLNGEDYVLYNFDRFIKTGLNYNFTFLIELDPL